MNLTTLFIAATAILTSLCLTFNKVLDSFIYYICKYLRDSSVYPYGPYMKSKPVYITYASIDNIRYTNKMELMACWKWNFDFGGITCDDLKLMHPDPKNITIRYTMNSILHECSINIELDSYTIDSKNKDILFGEISLTK
jgi:hypothetical protein